MTTERRNMKLRYNLQFFAGDNNGNTGTNNGNTSTNNTNTDGDTNTGTTNTDSNNTNTNGDGEQEIDPSAFADLISEKDKQIQQLQKDISELKKSNAMLTVRVNAGQKPPEFNTEKAILEFCDTRKLSK